jgi:lipoate-protein ligase A
MAARLALIRASFPEDPALDTALSRALLDRVAAGEQPDSFRLARPGAMVSFGRLDALEPGFPAAVAAARERGFAAVHRVGGGRAAIFHDGTLLFGHAAADPDPRAGTTRRFAAMAALLRGALGRLGVDATIGELPREYCPGAWSLHTGGVKLVGIAQRVVLGAAYTEGVLVVTGGERVRDVLVPVYGALGQPFDPATAGALDDVLAGVTPDAAAAALRAELATRLELHDAAPDAATLAAAADLRPRHDT